MPNECNTEKPVQRPAETTATVAVDFLEQLRPDGPWVLTAIKPEGGIQTITAKKASEICSFVNANNRRANLYYSVNPTRTAMTSKAAKVDIAAVEYVLADLDPRDDETSDAAKARYLEILGTLEPEPTAIVDSGNGIQVLWRLDNPIKLAEPVTVKNAKGQPERVLTPETAAVVDDVEARVKRLMLALGSVAGTQNIDRILRLPGTTNLPNKKKIKSGRVACPSKLIKISDATCTLDAFPAAAADTKSADSPSTIGGAKSRESASSVDFDELPISKRIKNLIRGIDDPKHPYKSRSEQMFAALVAMAAASCSDEQMTAVMMDTALPIGAHVRDQDKPEECLRRQIAKARKVAVDPDIAKLNETYAVVSIGGQAAILKECRSSEGEPDIKLLSVSAFHTLLANRRVFRSKKPVPLAKYWIEHPQRREYEDLVFSPGRDVPGYYNLWRGFAVEARVGDCSKFLAHLRDNVCRDNEEHYRWMIGWFAQMVQQPDKKPGTSLVIRGRQGTGKTKVGEVIGSLFGPHYVTVSDPRFITGRFNSHLVSCVLLHADEAFWAGDHTAESKLKDLVTGGWQLVEHKGKEPVRVRNHVRLLVTGNPDWLVPAALEERRFAVLDIGDARMNDHEYFAAIDRELDNGGREALLHYLLNYDLSTTNLRSIPKSAALVEQKLNSLSTEHAWWFDVLGSGKLPWGCAVPGHCPAELLFDDYIKHATATGARRRSIETKIGMFLNKVVPGLRKDVGTYRGRYGGEESGSIYQFPALADCRVRFAQIMQGELPWDGPEEWQPDPSRSPF